MARFVTLAEVDQGVCFVADDSAARPHVLRATRRGVGETRFIAAGIEQRE